MHAFCRSFDKGDGRIEATLRAIEAAIQLPLDHYVPRTLKPKKLSGDRVKLIGENLLPGDARKSLTTLCTPDDGGFVQVTVSNVGGPFNGYVRDPYAGCVFVMADGAIRDLVQHLGNVVRASEAFHAFADSDKFSRQQVLMPETIRVQRLALENLRSELGESNYFARLQLLENTAAECAPSLKVLPLKGIAPHRKEFDIRLHWITYLDAANARRFEFPNEAADNRLAGFYERLGDGWLLKVSHEEPDLRDTVIRERLEWMYRRFSEVG